MKKALVNRSSIAYVFRGAGKPLLLLHGWGADHSLWNEVSPYIENDFAIILPDLRGFGHSTMVGNRFTIRDLAADMAGLLDKLGIKQTFIAGHSMGSYVSLAFGRAYPERVLGLGIISSQADADPLEHRQGRYQAAEEILKNGVNEVASSFPPLLTGDVQVQATLRALIEEQKPEVLSAALVAIAERDDSRRALSKFNFPVVLVHGEADAIIPIQKARHVAAILPHARLVVLPGVGHVPPLEDPQATAQALKDLL